MPSDPSEPVICVFNPCMRLATPVTVMTPITTPVMVRQLLSRFDSPGTAKESGLVYIDDDGVGRNPY